MTRSSPWPQMAQYSTPSPTQTCEDQVVFMLLIWDRCWFRDFHQGFSLSYSWMGKAKRSWQLLLQRGMDFVG
ncbi:hypothetical protein DPMN_059400 [Dreissena polymorpha]|uniref:Uncharacterized protein n=1 Tax=Dreissena polymorpha TaxID=45954 RepID=A0A9D4HGK1_DREPO|nr:hypothetical protein DPMN_059400 [Dreissena polymorpha]